MRVWVDLTNSPHVLVLRPVIAALERRGAEVLVTARDFAQTLELCERFGDVILARRAQLDGGSARVRRDPGLLADLLAAPAHRIS